WFLECLERAIRRSNTEINKVMNKSRLWLNFSKRGLTDRQLKVVNRLLDAGPGGVEGGLSNQKYRGMAQTTRETAKRDMADLVAKGILIKNHGGGRSSSYDLDWPA
ncbi:MAG: DeoR family transcriptional regulator, partial [Deltaproteobacteria bacterium]|nr:DeoR family transcriptional regulator [Deltaproteobacteria bacterium]